MQTGKHMGSQSAKSEGQPMRAIEGVGPSVSRTRHWPGVGEKSVDDQPAGISLTRLTPDFFPTSRNFLGHENV
jgi:hypothetical protein